MKNIKKISVAILCGFGFLLVVMTALILLTPRLIELETIRQRIAGEASRIVSGKVAFSKIQLSFLPRPHLTITDGHLSIPGVTDGRLETLSVYPKLWPLVRGDVRISKLAVARPEFEIRFGQAAAGPVAKGTQGTTDQIKQKLIAIAGGIAALGSDVTVSIRKGRLKFSLNQAGDWTLDDMNVLISLPPDKVRLTVSAGSNLFEKVRLKGQIDLKTLSSLGEIELTHFRPHLLTGKLMQPEVMNVADSLLDATFKFETKGFDSLRIDWQGSIPDLTLRRKTEQIILKSGIFKGEFYKK